MWDACFWVFEYGLRILRLLVVMLLVAVDARFLACRVRDLMFWYAGLVQVLLIRTGRRGIVQTLDYSFVGCDCC